MKTVTYYAEAGKPGRKLSVLDENENGTLEIGVISAGKKDLLVVGKCPISEEPKTGHCVIDVEAPAEDESKPEGEAK